MCSKLALQCNWRRCINGKSAHLCLDTLHTAQYAMYSKINLNKWLVHLGLLPSYGKRLSSLSAHPFAVYFKLLNGSINLTCWLMLFHLLEKAMIVNFITCISSLIPFFLCWSLSFFPQQQIRLLSSWFEGRRLVGPQWS